MLRRLYDWTMRQAQGRHAMPALAAVSFIESSFFPIPPDVLLAPMVLADPKRAWRIAFVCTIASVIGGAFGYWIGWALFDTVGQKVLAFYGAADKFEEFRAFYNANGIWAVIFAGITPFPYKIITIASGVMHMNFWAFMAASLFARAFRFYLIAGLFWKFGEPVRGFIEKRLGLVFTVFMVLLIGGFYLAKIWAGGGA